MSHYRCALCGRRLVAGVSLGGALAYDVDGQTAVVCHVCQVESIREAVRRKWEDDDNEGEHDERND